MDTHHGGRAFPSPDWNGSWQGPEADHGMSLRDYFAAHALALFAGRAWDDEGDDLIAIWAQSAYALADSMLKARETPDAQ